MAYARICEVYEFPPVVLIIMTDSNSKYGLYWLDLVSSSDGQSALQTTYSTAFVMTQRALQNVAQSPSILYQLQAGLALQTRYDLNSPTFGQIFELHEYLNCMYLQIITTIRTANRITSRILLFLSQPAAHVK
jgi:hypothetical protein